MDQPATPSASSRKLLGVYAEQSPVRPAPYSSKPDAVHSSSVQRSQLSDQGDREFLESEGKVVFDQFVPNCYSEIQNVLWIEKDPVFRTALKDWERKEQLLSSRIERKKSSQENLANEIYTLIGYYSVFQGVLLTAVSQTNQIGASPVRFESRLCFILLSCSTSLLTILGVIAKLGRVREIATSIRIEEQDFGDVNVKVQELRRCGGRFKFRDRLYHKPSQLGTSLPRTVLVFVLSFFACLFPLTIWSITMSS